MGEIINGNVYEHTNYNWYGVGYIKMNDLGIVLIKNKGKNE